ncbi:hypothetical protein [Neoroseomonas soli]|uniref:Uncharacterized protein n=1 Tax=Neoroseomonas soli TaxID=1081025 RepID=A0A9X9WY46_9PROT|nr:hypothetical protein [Neoroseomonas soli]MBR0672075.1 hypothetical protein [Neoroseomonas soli]
MQMRMRMQVTLARLPAQGNLVAADRKQARPEGQRENLAAIAALPKPMIPAFAPAWAA